MKQSMKNCIERYFKTDKGKSALKKAASNYQQTEKGKAAVLSAVHRYNAKKRNLPADLTVKEWEQTLVYFGNRCAYCGKSSKLQQEHFVPVSKGGGYTRGNIVPACQSCNNSKNNKHPLDWLTGHANGQMIYSAIVQYLQEV